MRGLSPNGVAMVKEGPEWEKSVKPRPEIEDDWTHFLHGPDGNPVSQDLAVGPPRHLQWIGDPKWSRHHDHMASMGALVSAQGKVFYIVDEGSKASVQMPPKWFLIARDAFNGTILWKKPIARWFTHIWPLKSGPAQLPRRVVACGDVVYATLGIESPLTALDAATGKVLRTYEKSKSKRP